jgi:hypothetical protein
MTQKLIVNGSFSKKIEEAVRKGVKPLYSKEKIDKYLQIDMPREMIAALESAWDVQPWKRPFLSTSLPPLFAHFYPPFGLLLFK